MPIDDVLVANKELRENTERLRLALAAADMGTWEMDLVNGRRNWSGQTPQPAWIGAARLRR